MQQSRLQWNKLRITYGEYRLFVRYNALFQSKNLGVVRLGQHRLDRLELIEELTERGYSNKQISQYLNENGFKPHRVDQYTPKLVLGVKKEIPNKKRTVLKR